MTRLRHKWTTYIGKGSKAKVVVLSDALIKNVEAPSRERCLCADVSILSDSRQKKVGLSLFAFPVPGHIKVITFQRPIWRPTTQDCIGGPV